MECENFTSAVYHKVKNILKEQYIFTNKELAGEQKSSQKKKKKKASEWNLDRIKFMLLKLMIQKLSRVYEFIARKGGKNLLASQYSSAG